MSRSRSTIFVCQGCGHQAPRWLGRCPDCGEWNSLVEELVPQPARGASVAAAPPSANRPQPIGEVRMEAWDRVPSGLMELDRVLGGGVVPGSLVLLGGDPGIGKSTVLMQASASLARAAGRTLYVTGEESTQQVRLRAERLNALAPELYLVAETNLDAILAHLQETKPRYVVIDSIQTMHDPALESAPATVSQVRTCTARLLQVAKGTDTTVFLVGHVTKEGAIAGPRVLEHMVDTVLYFEGDRFQAYRVLRAVKNRFGSTDEIGLFEMTDGGLREVAGASELFLSQRGEQQGPGSAVVAVIEGTRPLLVEVQALVSRSFLPSPRRTTTGIDYNRACMILAVLEKRCGLRLSDKDVYVNVAGGLKVTEPGVDLGIAVALAGSFWDRPVDPEVVVAGEIGLAGELRSVSQMERRLREGARMGFKRAVVAGGKGDSTGVATTPAKTLREALDLALLPDRVAPPDADDPFADG